MDDDPDAAALSWDGETDPTHVAASGAQERVRRTRTRTDDRPSGTSSALLIFYGVFVGVYLLYTIGWAVAVLRNTLTLPDIFGEVMYQFGEFLAIVAPALWFFAALFFTRGHRPLVRVLWLALGILVLVPWPFVLGR